MTSRPIPAVGLRAFRLLTAAHDAKVEALIAQYTKDCADLGDDILTAMQVDASDPTYTVCYGDGIVTGFPAPQVDALIQETMAKLAVIRKADGVPTAGTIVDAPPAPAKTRRTRKAA